MTRYFDLSKETPLGQAIRVPSDDESLPNAFYGTRAVWLENLEHRQATDQVSTSGGQHVLGQYNIDRRTNAHKDTFETHVTLIGPETSLDISEMYLIEQDLIETYVDLAGLPEGPAKGMIGRPLRDLVTFEGPLAYLNDQIIDVVFPEDDEIMRFWVKRVPWTYRENGKG